MHFIAPLFLHEIIQLNFYPVYINAQFLRKDTLKVKLYQTRQIWGICCDRPIVRKRTIWVKIGDVLSRVTLKFDGWPWSFEPCDPQTWQMTMHKQKGAYSAYSMLLQALCSISYPLMNSNWSYSPETPNLGQIRRFLVPSNLEIWRMTLKNIRAPLLCYFELCASFRSHWWIQTWVTFRKHPIWVKFNDF